MDEWFIVTMDVWFIVTIDEWLTVAMDEWFIVTMDEWFTAVTMGEWFIVKMADQFAALIKPFDSHCSILRPSISLRERERVRAIDAPCWQIYCKDIERSIHLPRQTLIHD